MILELKPPAIVEAKHSKSNKNVELHKLLCHVILCNEDETECCSSVIVPTSDGKDQIEQQMRGGRVVSPLLLLDPDDHKKKLFFVFPDLAIKTHGRFRLVARLVNFER